MIFSKNIFKAIIRDIYQRKTRSLTILVSISIIIIFPVGFINSGPSLVTSLDHESEEAHLSHLEIFFLSINETLISDIDDLINPSAIDGRIRLTAIIENKMVNNQKQEVFLISIPDNNVSTVNIPKVSQGEFINVPGNIGILESFAEFLQVEIGDILFIKGKNGTIPLKVTSFMTSVEFMSYDILGNGVIYINYKDALQLAGLNNNSSDNIFNDIIIYFGTGKEVTTDFLKEKVGIIEKFLENDLNPLNDPQFIWFTQKSSVRSSLREGSELTGTYLGAAASFAVLVTGFVIFIIFNRYINEEKKIIGVLKSYGFNKKEIIFIFVGKAFVISLGSIILGTIGALIVLYAITSTIGNLWGITELFFVINIPLLIFFWVLALACSLIFALIPSYQVTKLTPYEALRETRGSYNSNNGLLDRIAGFLPSVPKMSIRTLTRNRLRTFLTIFSIISAMTLSIALLSSLSSVNYTVDNYFENNLLFDGRIEYYDNQNETELSYIQNQSGVITAEPNYYYLTNPLADISEVVSIRAIPVNSQNLKFDILEQDPTFSFELNNNSYTNQALVSERVLRRLNLNIGDSLTVKWKPGGFLYPNLTVKIMGMIRDFEYSIGVYISLPYLRQNLQNPDNYFTSLSVKLESNISNNFVNDQLSRPEISYVNMLTSIRSRVDRIINAQIFIVAITVFLGFLIAFISVFNTQYITIIERERDISVMMAFGFSRKYFLQEFLLEIILIVPGAVVIAIIASRPIAQFFLNLIEDAVVRMDYFLGETEIVFSLLFVILVAFAAAVIPAFYFVNTGRLTKILRADE